MNITDRWSAWPVFIILSCVVATYIYFYPTVYGDYCNFLWGK